MAEKEELGSHVYEVAFCECLHGVHGLIESESCEGRMKRGKKRAGGMERAGEERKKFSF